MSVPLNNIQQGGFGFGDPHPMNTAQCVPASGEQFVTVPLPRSNMEPGPQLLSYQQTPGMSQGPYMGVYGSPAPPLQSPESHSLMAQGNRGVISSQPRTIGPPGEWMNISYGRMNCPRGLEYLATVDQLIVKQELEPFEILLGFETSNKYTVKNALGQKVYFAAEDSNCCTRNLCGSMRPFDMKIFDNYKNEVMHLYRPLACSACCFPCCLQTMEVSAPPGNVLGTIEQDWSLLYPVYSIKNNIGDTVLHIEGPCCKLRCCKDVDFKIYSLTGQKVGKISKKWSGLLREAFTDTDVFGVTFPMDLDVRIKAVLLGATFLIDAMFYESSSEGAVNLTSLF